VKIFGDSGCASTVGWQSVEGAGALNGDLNQDAKHAKSKDKMYLCYHTTKDLVENGIETKMEGIVDLKVVEGKKTYCDREISDKYKNVIGGRATDKATDWNADLNNGVGGSYLYLCQAKSTEGARLVSLKFYESKGNCPKDYKIIEGSGGADGNFNQGAKGGGKSIYLCAKYDTIGEAMDNTETGPLLITFKYLTKAECNSKCLQWPVETGDQLRAPAPYPGHSCWLSQLTRSPPSTPLQMPRVLVQRVRQQDFLRWRMQALLDDVFQGDNRPTFPRTPRIGGLLSVHAQQRWVPRRLPWVVEVTVHLLCCFRLHLPFHPQVRRRHCLRRRADLYVLCAEGQRSQLHGNRPRGKRRDPPR